MRKKPVASAETLRLHAASIRGTIAVHQDTADSFAKRGTPLYDRLAVIGRLIADHFRAELKRIEGGAK
jgi:hypothetical protein